MEGSWSPAEQAHVQWMICMSAVRSPATVGHFLESLIEQTDCDELMVVAHLFDHWARLRSIELTARILTAIDRDLRRAHVPVSTPAG